MLLSQPRPVVSFRATPLLTSRAAVTPLRAATSEPLRRLAASRSAVRALRLSTAVRCVAAADSTAEAAEAEATELQSDPGLLHVIFQPEPPPLLELVSAASTVKVAEAASSTVGGQAADKGVATAYERKVIAAAAAVIQQLGGSIDTRTLRNLLCRRNSQPHGRLYTFLKRFPEQFLLSKPAKGPYDVRLVAQAQPAPEPNELQPGDVGGAVSQQQSAEPPAKQMPEPVPMLPPPPPLRGAQRYILPTRVKWSPAGGRSAAQRNYHDALFSGLASYVIAVGPAGTGKTHMAVQAGAAALLSGAAQRLIITRPVVTVGEDLGYLPGSMDKKMEPYLVPILDLLADIWSADELEDLQENRKLQIVPLGFMRGRTFNNAFIVADEMQNCSKVQMRTLLTRLGQESRVVVTGDLNQADAGTYSNGLSYLVRKLRAQLHGEAAPADAGDEDATAEQDSPDSGSASSEQRLQLRDAVRRDFELVVLDNASVQRNAAVQTVLRLLG